MNTVSSPIPLSEKEILNFRNNLIGIQKDEGISNKELAQLIGVTPEYVSKIRNGKARPSARISADLANLVNVPEQDLFLTPQERKYKEWAVYGRKLQKARMAKGLHAGDIAAFLGTTLEVYKQLEDGKCYASASWVEKLDKLLFDHKEEEKKDAPAEAAEAKPEPAIPAEIPMATIDIIISHVRDLKVAPESQREIFRTLSEYKLRKQEEELFGKEA